MEGRGRGRQSLVRAANPAALPRSAVCHTPKPLSEAAPSVPGPAGPVRLRTMSADQQQAQWLPPSPSQAVTPLDGLDVLVIVAYFAVVVAVAVWAGRRGKSKASLAQGEDGASADYFLAAESVPWAATAASLFLSNVGAEHFLGLCGTGAASGIAVGFFEWGAVPTLLALGYVALPAFAAGRLFTTPEFASRRFGQWAGSVLVCVSLALYVFTKISATLYAGQVVLAQVGGLDPWASAASLIVACAVYAGVGGLAAVVYTEVVQAVVLVAGGAGVLALGLAAVGGPTALYTALAPPPGFVPNGTLAGIAEYPTWDPAAGRPLAVPYEGYSRWSLWRPADDAAYPWPGLSTGYFVIGFWYWATDQSIVQRGMAARNVAHGRAGAVAAAWLKLLPVFGMVVPGMIARVLMAADGVVPPTVPTSAVPPALLDTAFPWLVARVVPAGLRGLVVAAVLSALMSSLASVFNSAATLFAVDVVGPCARDDATCCGAGVRRMGALSCPAPCAEGSMGDRGCCRRGGGAGATGERAAILGAAATTQGAGGAAAAGGTAGGGGAGHGASPGAAAAATAATAAAAPGSPGSAAYRSALDAGLVWVGRAAVAGVGAVSLAWLPVIPLLGNQLFAYVQKPPSFLAGPILSVYLVGMLWPGARPAGAALGLGVGLGVGLVRMVGESVIDAGGGVIFRPGSAADVFFGTHYLVFAAVSLVGSCLLVVAGSLLLPDVRCRGARVSAEPPCGRRPDDEHDSVTSGLARPASGSPAAGAAELDELCVWRPGTFGRVLRRQLDRADPKKPSCASDRAAWATHAAAVAVMVAATALCVTFSF